MRVTLTNIKAPKPGNPKVPGSSEPWGKTAKEFMRKKFIGKEVTVTIDEMKKVKLEDDRELTFINTTLVNEKLNLGIELLRNGYAIVRQVRMNDNTSSCITEYQKAYDKAQSNRKGIHGNKMEEHIKYFDMTKKENRKKGSVEF